MILLYQRVSHHREARKCESAPYRILFNVVSFFRSWLFPEGLRAYHLFDFYRLDQVFRGYPHLPGAFSELDLLLLCLLGVADIIISKVFILAIAVQSCHGYMTMYPASCEYCHIRQGIDGDMDVSPVLSGSDHIDESEIYPEELRTLPEPLHKVRRIIPELSDRFRLFSFAIGQCHAPKVLVIEVRVHELPQLIRPVSHVRSLYAFRSGFQLPPPLPLRDSSGPY